MERYDTDRSGNLRFFEFVEMLMDTSEDAVFKLKIDDATKRSVFRLSQQ